MLVWGCNSGLLGPHLVLSSCCLDQTALWVPNIIAYGDQLRANMQSSLEECMPCACSDTAGLVQQASLQLSLPSAYSGSLLVSSSVQLAAHNVLLLWAEPGVGLWRQVLEGVEAPIVQKIVCCTPYGVLLGATGPYGCQRSVRLYMHRPVSLLPSSCIRLHQVQNLPA